MRSSRVLNTSCLSLKDAETGQRGFVLTGEERYLEPYHAATGEVHHDIDALADLTRDNAAQQEGLRQVRKLADAKLAELRQDDPTPPEVGP